MSKAKYHVPQPGELVEFQNAGGLREKVIVSKWDSKHGIITSIGAARYQVGNRSTIKLVGPSPFTAPKIDKPTIPATRRPTVGDWVEIVKIEEGNAFKVGDIVEIMRDDQDKIPYYVYFENRACWMEEDQVKLTDKRPTDTSAPDSTTASKISPLPTQFSDALKSRPRTEEHLFREPPHGQTATEAIAQCAAVAEAHHIVTLPTSFASEAARAKAIADAEVENKKRHEAAEAECDELADMIAALVNERCEIIREDENAQHDFENRLEYLRSLRIRQGK